MLEIKFPVDPHSVQNLTHDGEGNVYDIVLQGHRRSLFDWLAITKKSLNEYNNLRQRGFTARQSLVFGLPFQDMSGSRQPAYFAHPKPLLEYKPLPDMPLRLARLKTSFCKFIPSLPVHLRAPWSHRLLSGVHRSHCENRPWKLRATDYYPHCVVIPLTSQEQEDLDALRHLVPRYLIGDDTSGYWPTKSLLRHYKSDSKRNAAFHVWAPLIEDLEITEPITFTKLCKLLNVHRFIVMQAWASASVSVTGLGYLDKKDWLKLAISVDTTRKVVQEKRVREQTTMGNRRKNVSYITE